MAVHPPSHPSSNHDQRFAATLTLALRWHVRRPDVLARVTDRPKQFRINRLRCVGPTRKFLGDPVRDEGSSWTGQGPASRARASSPCPSGPRARCPCHGLPSGADCGSAHGLLLAQAKCQVNRSPSRETRPAEDSAKWVVKTSELVSAAWFIAHRRYFRAASGTDHRSEVIFDHEDGRADAGWVRCGAIRAYRSVTRYTRSTGKSPTA